MTALCHTHTLFSIQSLPGAPALELSSAGGQETGNGWGGACMKEKGAGFSSSDSYQKIGGQGSDNRGQERVTDWQLGREEAGTEPEKQR